jgi:hypothetical protein
MQQSDDGSQDESMESQTPHEVNISSTLEDLQIDEQR